MKDSLILAHYYTTPEVQAMADYVGDSLDLALRAKKERADRIIFAGVRFMAETAKILNPSAEVILPDERSTCSLVEQTDIIRLKQWIREYEDHVHVAYINSSAEHKASADIIVTSRIVDDVINKLYEQGKKVIFSPDRNMGQYLNFQYGYSMPVWSAVCEVHDKFSQQQLLEAISGEQFLRHTNYVIAHPESPLPVLELASYIGSTHGMLKWIKEFRHNPYSSIIWVATEEGLLYNMRELRSDLDIRQAPIYSGCQCNQCPYMKYNTVDLIREGNGQKIDYLDHRLMERAAVPINRMLYFQETGRIKI